MKLIGFMVLMALWAPCLPAKTISKEVVQESEKRETRRFCSKKSKEEAREVCDKWLERQVKNLGERLLTSYCDQGELNTDASGKCLYRVIGEVKYVLKTYKTEKVVTE